MSEMLLKPELNSNNSFSYITGYDNLDELKLFIKSYINKNTYIYIDKKIDSPSFDEAELIMSFVKTKDVVTMQSDELKNLLLKFYPDFSSATRIHLTESLVNIIKKLVSNSSLNNTLIKNAFVKILKAIDSTFLDVVKSMDSGKKVNLIFYGDVSKYDLLSLEILNSLGIGIVIISCKRPVELITYSYKLYNGSLNQFEPIKVILDGNDVDSPIICNSWLKINKKDTIENYLNSIYKSSIVRIDISGYKTLNIGFSGVLEETSYELALYNFYLSNKDNMLVLDNGFSNPTYDELQDYEKYYSKYSNIEDILKEYICFNDTVIPKRVFLKMEEVLHSFSDNEGKRKSVEKIYLIWILRLCNKFFKSKLNIDNIPILVLFGKINDKFAEALNIFSELPIDIIHFSTNKQWELNKENFIYIDLGASSLTLKKYPTEINTVTSVETVAYSAEKELQSLLYSDNLIFKFKQFNSINSVVLKTTYEEAGVLWNEPAKFRPSFNSAGDVVTVPTIFMKVNGTKKNINEYLSSIKDKRVQDTVVVTEFPYIKPLDTSSDLYQFVKQVIFNKKVDFKRIKESSYWRYGLYSVETQNLICNSIQNMMTMEWTNGFDSKFVYKLLYVLLTLPDDIVKLIHKYDFTSNIPKLIYFNCGDIQCSIEDCILIMFLKSLAFDIMIYAPTGYLIIEKFIDKKYFTTVELGDYVFDLTPESLNRVNITSGKKKGIFSNLFK